MSCGARRWVARWTSCETKGLDFIDREKAKRQAREQVGQVKHSSNELC